MGSISTKKGSGQILDTPRFVAWAILEYSKCAIFNCWYEAIKPKFGKNVQLLMMDTDSLIYKVTGESAEADDCPEYGVFFGGKELGEFKDETAPSHIARFAGPAPKCYCLDVYPPKLDEGAQESEWDFEAGEPEAEPAFECYNKMKGIPKHKVKKQNFQAYKDSIFKPESAIVSFKGMRMQGFQIFQYDFKKKFFSSFNDKVFMCDDLSCRPLGH